MGFDARRRLIEKALAILDEGGTLLVVPLNEFFEGNTDEASIGVNLPEDKHIGLAGFRRVLSGIRDRPDVQGVFLELTEIPDPDEEQDDGIWPTACVAFVITSAPLNRVGQWAAPLHPRDISEGWCIQPGVKTPLADTELQPGMRPVRVWLLSPPTSEEGKSERAGLERHRRRKGQRPERAEAPGIYREAV